MAFQLLYTRAESRIRRSTIDTDVHLHVAVSGIERVALGHVQGSSVVYPSAVGYFHYGTYRSVGQDGLPAPSHGVDVAGFVVLVTSERTCAHRLSGPEDVTTVSLCQLFGRGVESGAVHLQPIGGFAVQVDALPVVHVDAERCQSAFENRTVPVDTVVHVQQIGIAGIGDGFHFRMLSFLVVQFQVSACFARVASGSVRIGQRDTVHGLTLRRDVGREGQFVGSEVAVQVVRLRGDFPSVADDFSRPYMQAVGMAVQVDHHRIGFACHPRGIGYAYFPYDFTGLSRSCAGQAYQEPGR